MTRATHLMGMGLVVGLVGCSGPGPAPTLQETQGERSFSRFSPSVSSSSTFLGWTAPVQVDSAPSPVEAEYDRRVITRLPAPGPCPAPSPGWSSRLLFRTATASAVPGPMSRFCLFTWSGTTSPTTAPYANGSNLESVRDHMGVAPAAPLTLTEITQAGYASEYQASVGEAPAHRGLNPVLPRIAILDTSPDSSAGLSGWETLGMNDHGYALANMVRNLQSVPLGGGLRGDTTEVTTRLVMDMYVDATTGEVIRDPIGGGDFGTIGILAEGIHAEVDAWRHRGDGEPLIINLSLGWEPLYGGSAASPADWPIDVQAVHAALYEAACEGAVVIASSGNRAGGPLGNEDPIFPAAWGTRLIQDTECAALLGGVAADYAALDESPLIYAVGGVDERGQDLAVSRLNSRPALVAYGDHAVDVDHTGAYTSILTGTSVSAAVVSSIAGVAWHNAPSMLGRDVIQAIEDAGATTGRPVEAPFCPSGACGDAVVADLCLTIIDMCARAYPASCSNIDPGASCATTPVDGTPDAADVAAFEASTGIVPLTFPYPPVTDAACSGGLTDLYSETARRADDPCPQEQYYDFVVEPWTNPQPTHDTCPPCYIDTGSGNLYLEWEGRLSDMDSLSLYLQDSSGNTKTLTTKNVPATDSVTYSLSPSTFAGVEKAWITGVQGTQSYSAGIELR